MKWLREEIGQGLVEFALVITILFLIVLGALDLGRAFHATIVITNASREGMRYLTLHPMDSTAGFAGTKNAAIAEAQGSSITLAPGQITVPLCIDIDPFLGCDSGTRARVTVTYPFKLILTFFIRTPFNITRSTEMIIP
jgi:Flp pilus assembly protein TadG